MKKIYFISLLCAAVMFVSCGKKTTNLENSIPNDAVTVMRFDIKSLLSKADCNLLENPKVKTMIEKGMSKMTDAKKKVFNNFVKNPNSLGIDVIGDAYFFMNGQIMGFVMSVNDAKKIYNNFTAIDKQFEQMIETKNGVYSLSNIDDDSGTTIMWDKSKFLLLIPYGRNIFTDNADSTDLSEYFNLTPEKSIVSDKNYQKFASSKSDISTYYSYSNYGKMMNNLLNDRIDRMDGDSDGQADLLKQVMAVYENFNGVSVAINCNFDKGAINSKMQMLYETAEVEKKITELYDNSQTKLSGEFLKYVPQNPLLLLATDFDGEKVLAAIDKLNLTSLIDLAAEKTQVDIKKLIGSINGDVQLSINNISFDNGNLLADGSMFAKLSNPDFIKTELDKLSAIQSTGFDSSKFGVKGDVFYFISDDNAKKMFETGGTENPLIKKIKDQPMFLYGDLSGLKESIQPLYEQNFQLKMFQPTIDKGLSLITTFEGKQVDKNNMELTVNFADKKQNSLKQIFCFIEDVISVIPQ